MAEQSVAFTESEVTSKHPHWSAQEVSAWLRSANAALEQCTSSGRSQGFCKRRAVQCGDAAVRKMSTARAKAAQPVNGSKIDKAAEKGDAASD